MINARRLLVLALALSLGLNAWLALRWRSHPPDSTQAMQRYLSFVMDSLGSTLSFQEPPPGPWGRDTVYWQWNAVTARLQSRRWQQAVLHWKNQSGMRLEDYELRRLMQQGLADPVHDLRESLVGHREMIPIPGVLGGTMHFDPESFVILNQEYAFAAFEDGHIGGYLLARYRVDDGGKIGWERVWAARN